MPKSLTQSLLRALLLPLVAAALLLTLTACKPTYNWRDYSSPDAPFRVMFPDKPSVHKRQIDIGGMPVEMTMTAVDVHGTTFAVGSAVAPDAAKAQAALAAMQSVLVRNIGATVKKQKSSAVAAAGGSSSAQGATIDVEASGVQNGTPMKLIGHFESRNQRFYQVIVIGKEKDVSPEQVDQFIASFKLL